MAFFRAPLRTSPPARLRVPVFAVGRRAYIVRARDRSARVTLMDGAERPLANLSDGAEVTILAWLPGRASTTRYCVRVTDSGLEGWLPVGDLRGTRNAISSPPVPPPPTVRPALGAGPSDRSGRRFAQRF